MNQKTWPFFFVALLFLMIAPFPLLPFSPYLALLYRRSSFIKSLWIAALCGGVMDLFTDRPFGLYAFNLTLVTFLLYRLRVYFVDKPIGLASYTAVLSLSTTLISWILFSLTGQSLPITFQGIVANFLFMPLADSLYGILCFILPLTFYRLGKRLYFRFLLIREEFKTKEEIVTPSKRKT
jgi:rod shape-determining protein MreD